MKRARKATRTILVVFVRATDLRFASRREASSASVPVFPVTIPAHHCLPRPKAPTWTVLKCTKERHAPRGVGSGRRPVQHRVTRGRGRCDRFSDLAREKTPHQKFQRITTLASRLQGPWHRPGPKGTGVVRGYAACRGGRCGGSGIHAGQGRVSFWALQRALRHSNSRSTQLIHNTYNSSGLGDTWCGKWGRIP